MILASFAAAKSTSSCVASLLSFTVTASWIASVNAALSSSVSSYFVRSSAFALSIVFFRSVLSMTFSAYPYTFHSITPQPCVFGLIFIRIAVVVTGANVVVLYLFSSVPQPDTFGRSRQLPFASLY